MPQVFIKYQHHEFDTSEKRQLFAKCVSDMMWNHPKSNCPYVPPAKKSDYFWTCDDDNDWKVKFFDDDPKKVEIVHRYKNTIAMTSLAEWIANRTCGKAVIND